MHAVVVMHTACRPLGENKVEYLILKGTYEE